MNGRLSWRDRLRLGLPLLPIAGGIDIPSAQAIAEKYVRVTSQRGGDYTAGVQRVNPGDFESRAQAGEDAWVAGVTTAAGDRRRSAGLTGSGPRWRRKAEQLGSQRFPTGVTAARDDMSTGVAPYVAVIQGLQLDPRGPRGSPGNLQRVNAVATALNQRRLQRS